MREKASVKFVYFFFLISKLNLFLGYMVGNILLIGNVEEKKNKNG